MIFVNKDIQFIPKKFLTQEMCNEYFENTKNIENIPIKFLTIKIVFKTIKNMLISFLRKY